MGAAGVKAGIYARVEVWPRTEAVATEAAGFKVGREDLQTGGVKLRETGLKTTPSCLVQRMVGGVVPHTELGSEEIKNFLWPCYF